jgi:hypothetical protein
VGEEEVFVLERVLCVQLVIWLVSCWLFWLKYKDNWRICRPY